MSSRSNGARRNQPCRLHALGMVNALGAGTAEIWPRLLAGDQSQFRRRDDAVPGREIFVGEVTIPLPEVPSRLARFACRNNQLTLAALTQLEKPIHDAISEFGRDRIGVVVGSSTSGVGDAETAIRHHHATGELTKSFQYDQLEFGGAASFAAEMLDVNGPCYSISTACSSGARALTTARSLLALGICDAVIAGATDSLCGLTMNGFSSLQVISDRVTNPYSVNRDGLTLGEGSALFLVTRDPGGIQLGGIGESTEAHHMSAPDPDGAGAELAMKGALRDARLDAAEIRYVNLHGTGTQLNDAMESAAIARTFPIPPPCSSTKTMTGHTLGGAGAIEAGFCWMILDQQNPDGLDLIPHLYDGAFDADLGVDCLVRSGQRTDAGPIMSNSFGFGGNNCTLILQRSPR